MGDSAETLCLSGLPFKLINTAAFCEGVHSEELKDGMEDRRKRHSLYHTYTRLALLYLQHTSSPATPAAHV